MDGYKIKYKAFDKGSRVILNHALFGRLISRQTKKNVVYYQRGMLDDVAFYRIKGGEIFVTSLDKLSIEELRIFGDISVEKCSLDIDEDKMVTADEYWTEKAKDRSVIMRQCRSSYQR